MKRTILLIAVIAFGCIQLKAEKINSNQASESSLAVGPVASDGDKGGGFFIHFSGMLPSKNYMIPKAFENESDLKYGFGGGFELGNMFEITQFGSNSIGVRAVWFGATYTSQKVNDSTSFGIAQASTAKFGPYFSAGLENDMAVDVYYQLAPTFAVEVINGGDPLLGISHSLGAGFRMKVLSVGMDYNFGNITDFTNVGDAPDEYKDWFKVRTNHFRFFIGFMF